MYQNTLAIFLQLLFTSLAFAAPIEAQGHENAWQYGAGGGLIGFIVLVLDVIVWLEVLKSDRPVTHKLLWSILVFIFPIGGIVIYWLFSNREAHKGGYESIA